MSDLVPQFVSDGTVYEKDGQAMTNSLKIATRFGKQHKNVLQAVANLDCSSEFNRLNFKPVEYRDAKGESRPSIEMTRDGMMFLVTGFTGSEAARWKELLIAAFNYFEGRVKQLEQAIDLTSGRVGNFIVPTTLSSALRLYAGAIEANENLQARKNELEAENGTLKEDADAYQRFAGVEGWQNIKDVAKVMQVKQQWFYKWLLSEKIIYQGNTDGVYRPYAPFVERGWMRLAEKVRIDADGQQRLMLWTVVSAEGMANLAKRLNKLKQAEQLKLLPAPRADAERRGIA